MYTKAATSLILLILIGIANADCSIGFDYCQNYTTATSIDLVNYCNPALDCTVIPFVGFDFSAFGNNPIYPGEYIKDNLTNVKITAYNSSEIGITAITTLRKIARIEVNKSTAATLPATIEICINNTLGLTHPTSEAIACPGTCMNTIGYVITPNNMLNYYSRNWTFMDEDTNTIFNFTGTTSNLNVWCNTLSPFDINLTSRLGNGGSMIIQTQQKPIYKAEVDDYLVRIREDAEHFLTDNYYLSTETSASQYTFLLNDYTTDQYKGSTLYIQRYIDDDLANIHVQTFPNDNTLYANLQNNTQYKIVLQNAFTTKDLGALLIVDTDTTKNINIGEATLYGLQTLWNGISYAWIGDYNASQVGATVTSPTSVTATFTVKNASTSPYVTTYTSTTSGTSVTFTYTTPNRGVSMMLYLDITDADGNKYNFRRLVQLADSTAPLNTTAFNPTIPDNALGSSTKTIKKMMATLISLFVLFTVSKASKAGIGAIMAVVTYSFFWYVNYIPHDQVPWFILPILGLFAVSLAMFERRT